MSLLTTVVFPIGVCADFDLCTVTTMFWRSISGLRPTSPSYPIVMNLFDFLLDDGVDSAAATSLLARPAEVGVRVTTIAFSSVNFLAAAAAEDDDDLLSALRCAERLPGILLGEAVVVGVRPPPPMWVHLTFS